MSDSKIDKSCIPYPRKGVYWIINLLYLSLLILTTFYLWQFSILVSIVYFSLYIVSVILHGYICAFSECPYTGTWCHGAFAWFPVGKVSLLFKKLKLQKFDSLINLFFMFIMLTILGIIILPLQWISKLGIVYSVGYVGLILVYFFIFVLSICPKCAMRLQCPTAKLSSWLYKRVFKKDILEFN